MFRNRRIRLVGLALGLGLLAAAPATASPIVTVPDSWARITVYPSTPTVTVPESWGRIRVYPSTPIVTVPESWARITVYPSKRLAGRPTVRAASASGGSGDSSFDWASAGVGAGFMAGLGAVAIGSAFALRRRRLVDA